MTPEPSPRADAASCPSLAAHLHTGAHGLRRAASDEADAPVSPEADVAALAAAMDTLADALEEFARSTREGRPTPPGLPHPHTTLRVAAREVLLRLR